MFANALEPRSLITERSTSAELARLRKVKWVLYLRIVTTGIISNLILRKIPHFETAPMRSVTERAWRHHIMQFTRIIAVIAFTPSFMNFARLLIAQTIGVAHDDISHLALR